ncbi:MAG: M48 family metallopeptidase [Thermoplasmatota archaeon]
MVSNASLRYPGEWFDLMIAITLGVIIFLVLGTLTWGVCCFWGIVGVIVVLFMVAVANSHLREVCTRVGEEGTPGLASLCNEVSERLGMKMPEVYLDGAPEVNAYTRGIVTPVVVLQGGLMSVMDRKELRFVIGHEFGHVKLYHFAIRTMFDSSIFRVPLLAYIPLMIYRLIFLNGRMSRSMEHSADRAGLHGCRSINSAVSCMIKLKTGRKNIDKGSMSRAVAGKLDLDDDEGFLSELLSTHPDFEDRIKELVSYSRETGIGWGE